MGFDDRKKEATSALPQLMGHTKTYTKVVLDQTSDVFGEVDPKSLIGKCVKVKITEAQKWHVAGYITDFKPEPERVPVDYFERLEATRKDEIIKQF